MSGVKRKREGKTTEIRVSSFTEEPTAVVGSLFNGLVVPNSTEFDVYKHKKQDKFLIHGENSTLDYNGQTEDDETNQYYVGLYDPLNKSIDLYRAPYVNARVSAKSSRSFKGPAIKSIGDRHIVQRNALGEAFGTKKAKSAIASAERNRIDADKLADIELDIIDHVSKSTQDLPTREKMAQEVVDDRPTPIANVDATNVEDVYPVYNIIPKKEWSFLRIQPLLDEAEDKARLELLPYSKSSYIAKTLPSLITQNNHEKLQLLMYASLLFGVYDNRRVRDKETLMTRLQNKPSEILLDGILERFTIAKASQFGKSKDRSFLIDPHHEDKLLCYLLAIILHLNNFMVELPPLAHELNMKPTRLVGLFKALGATIKSATVGQAEAFGIPKNMAATYKVASLKVPFKLPEMTRRGKKSR